MRIVAGERRGMPLVAPRGREVRPTSDRVRQALFSMLGDVSEAVVLDAFAGTGALALEALSRGAERALLWERSAAAVRVIEHNVERLGYRDRVEVVRTDAVRALAAEHRRGRLFDLILLDPPYTILAALQRPFAQHLAAILDPDGIVVLEGPAGRPEPELPLAVWRSREYGGTRISLLSHPSAA